MRAQRGAVLDGGDEVFSVGIEMMLKSETMAGNELPAIARCMNYHRLSRFFLHTKAGGSDIVLENVLKFSGLFRSRLAHAVKALRITAWIIVALEFLVASQLELMVDLSGFER